jgi:hypothetical protein
MGLTMPKSKSAVARLFVQVRVAVTSVRQYTTMIPLVIVNGERNEITEWLATVDGVLVMFVPAPPWREQLLALNAPNRAEFSEKYSPLYADDDAVVGTHLRIDLSVFGLLDDYVFYTDTDVMFVRDVTLSDFKVALGGQLPDFYACASESKVDDRNEIVCNAGVMLMNLRGMRHTHDDFVAWILNQPSTHHGEYGPSDQGALAEFYRNRWGWLPSIFNWGVYFPDADGVMLLHFHGPKLEDYTAYFRGEPTRDAFKGIFAQCGDSCKKRLELTRGIASRRRYRAEPKAVRV